MNRRKLIVIIAVSLGFLLMVFGGVFLNNWASSYVWESIVEVFKLGI